MNILHRLTFSMIMLNVISLSHPTYAANQVTLNESHDSFTNNTQLNHIVKLSHRYEFKSNTQVALATGTKHKFIEYYLGIPIWGASLTATELKGAFHHLRGTYLANIENDLMSATPKISKITAINKAMSYKKISPKIKSLITNEQIHTYIILDKNQTARLVYQISFMINDNNPSRPYFIFDANTGELIKEWEGLTTKGAIGPGGNEKTGKYNYGTNLPALIVEEDCQMINWNISTRDMKNMTSGGEIYRFDCTGKPPINNYKFTNGAYSPLNDAHFFASVVNNMYRLSLKSSAIPFPRVQVHYGVNYEKAFWDGEYLSFGDGHTRFYPLVSLDIISHEMSHGFTEQHSKLIYTKQPGAINESFSDIAGEAAKYYNNPHKPTKQRNDWLVGAAIMKNETALRYFDDPTRDGHSIGHTNQYSDDLDVHYSSGIFNKAFYKLARKANWNTEKAFRVFVLANQIYWHQESDFVNAACGVKRAAQDFLYNTQDVVDAFKAVGVYAGCEVHTIPELKNGDTQLNLLGREGEERYWYINVPAGKSELLIKITGSETSGRADLYVKIGQRPNSKVFDCKPFASDSNQTCLFENPKPGNYFIMIKGYTDYHLVNLLAKY